MPDFAVQALCAAQEAMEHDDAARAVAILEKCIARHEEHPVAEVLLALGNAHWTLGEVDKARIAFEKGYETAPDNALLCRNYALTLSESERHAEASRLFEKAYSLDGTEHVLLYHAAAEAFRADNATRCRDLLRALFAVVPAVEPAWAELMAHACLRIPALAEAESVLDATLSRHPDQTRLWRLLGHVRLMRDNTAGAAAALEIACRIGPASPSDWSTLADIYFSLDAPLEAVRCLLRHDDADRANEAPNANAVHEANTTNATDDTRRMAPTRKAARALASTGRTERAIALLDTALAATPAQDLYMDKARILFDAGRFADCRATLAACLATNAANRRALVLDAYAAWNLGDWTAAERSLRAADAQPAPRKDTTVHQLLAYIEDLLRERDDAKRIATEGIPNDRD